MRHPSLFRNLKYVLLNDFDLLSPLARTLNVLVANRILRLIALPIDRVSEKKTISSPFASSGLARPTI